MKSNIIKFPNLLEPNLVVGNTIKVPVVRASVSAGDPTDIPEQGEFDEFMDVPEEFLTDPDNNFIHKIKGDSMFPTLKDGDIIIVNCSDSSRYDGIVGKVILAYTEDGYNAKRVQKIKGRYYLVPDNKKYPTREITEFMSFEVKGVVTGVIKFEKVE
jgi:SOS-response transcriptional repressor LexA